MPRGAHFGRIAVLSTSVASFLVFVIVTSVILPHFLSFFWLLLSILHPLSFVLVAVHQPKARTATSQGGAVEVAMRPWQRQ